MILVILNTAGKYHKQISNGNLEIKVNNNTQISYLLNYIYMSISLPLQLLKLDSLLHPVSLGSFVLYYLFAKKDRR